MKWFRRKRVLHNMEKHTEFKWKDPFCQENIEHWASLMNRDYLKGKPKYHPDVKEYHFECRKCGNKWSNKSIFEPTGIEICQCGHMRCGKNINHEVKMLMNSDNGTSFACSECYIEYFKPKEEPKMKDHLKVDVNLTYKEKLLYMAELFFKLYDEEMCFQRGASFQQIISEDTDLLAFVNEIEEEAKNERI